MKRFFALITALVLALSLLSSCASPAVRYRSVSVDKDIFDYLYASYKYVYMTEHKGISDTEEGWKAECRTGVTYEEDLRLSFEDFVRRLTVASALYEAEPRLHSDTSLARSTVSGYIEDLFYYEDPSDHGEISSLLSPYGTDYDGLYYTFLMLYRYGRLRTALFGSSGIGVIGDQNYADTVKSYYDENCIYVRYLALSADSEKKDEVDSAFAAVTDLEGFEDFLESYADSDDTKAVFYRYQSYSTVDAAILSALTALSVGETVRVASGGTVFYLYRAETGEEYKDATLLTTLSDFILDVADICYGQYLSDLVGEVEITKALPHPWEIEACRDYNAIYHWNSYNG